MADFILWAGGTAAAYLYFSNRHDFANSRLGSNADTKVPFERNYRRVNLHVNNKAAPADSALQNINRDNITSGGILADPAYQQAFSMRREKMMREDPGYLDPFKRYSGVRRPGPIRATSIGHSHEYMVYPDITPEMSSADRICQTESRTNIKYTPVQMKSHTPSTDSPFLNDDAFNRAVVNSVASTGIYY